MQKRAEKEVRKAIKPWTPKGRTVDVRPSIVPLGGDLRHPITAVAFEVTAQLELPEGTNLWKRALHRMSRSSNRSYLVRVDSAGTAQILQEVSQTPQARLYRKLNRYLPLKELLHDFVHSDGVHNALATGCAGLFASGLSPLLTGAALGAAAKMAFDGIKRRKEARGKAMQETVEWAQNEQKEQGCYPDLMKTYRHFKDQLEEVKPGTYAWPLKRFYIKLADSGL